MKEKLEDEKWILSLISLSLKMWRYETLILEMLHLNNYTYKNRMAH